MTALKENDPFDRQFYEITVFTGFGSSAGTTANVYFQLSGDENQTEVRQLKDENRKVFQKRAEDIFLASFQEGIGDLQYVRIWHDNTGTSSLLVISYVFFTPNRKVLRWKSLLGQFQIDNLNESHRSFPAIPEVYFYFPLFEMKFELYPSIFEARNCRSIFSMQRILGLIP